MWAESYGYGGGDVIRYRANLASGGFSATATTLVGPLSVDQKILGLSFGTLRRPIDFNADARADLLYRTAERFTNALLVPAPEPSAMSTALDPMGSSGTLADTTVAAGFNYVYSIQVYCPGSPATAYGVGSTDAASTPLFGDLNGDGKTDLLYYDNSTYWKYRYSTGAGFTSAQTGPGINAYSSWIVQAWDRGGYDDALGLQAGGSGTAWYLMRSTGNVFATPVTTNVSSVNANLARTTADVDGDGLQDLVYTSTAGAVLDRRHTLDTALPDLLSSVQDAYGTQATFTYLPLSNAAVYSRERGSQKPRGRDRQAGVSGSRASREGWRSRRLCALGARGWCERREGSRPPWPDG